MGKAVNTILAVLLILGLANCENGTDPGKRTPPRELTKTEGELVESDNAFGFALFQKLNEDENGKNVFISPVSAAMALGMTMNGADGETRTAMEEALRLSGWNQDDINSSYKSLIELLRGLDPDVTFTIANSIWIRDGFSVKQEFIDENTDFFDARTESLDFNSDGASQIINDWVREKTNDKINGIVPQKISPMTMMYLVNAIYFKGEWAKKFKKEKTQEQEFTLPDGKTVKVPLMGGGGEYPYYQDEELQAIDMPYGYGDYSMTVLLPSEGTDIDAFTQELTREKWNNVTGKLHPSDGSIELPRFTLSYEKTFNDVLSALGMGAAFDPNMADFNKINPDAQLYISSVKQKAFVEVNEEGTEAAAATSVEVSTTSAPADPFYMRVDRPFVFAIREKHSGVILFIGKIVDPSLKE